MHMGSKLLIPILLGDNHVFLESAIMSLILQLQNTLRKASKPEIKTAEEKNF